MGRFVEGWDRGQTALFPECLDDYVNADNPVRVIDTHERNYTRAKLARRMAEVEASIASYMAALEAGYDAEAGATSTTTLGRLRERMMELKEIEERLEEAPDGQISLTDPDARAMATATERRGVVGYNVQAAVDASHHPIIKHRGHEQGLRPCAAR